MLYRQTFMLLVNSRWFWMKQKILQEWERGHLFVTEVHWLVMHCRKLGGGDGGQPSVWPVQLFFSWLSGIDLLFVVDLTVLSNDIPHIFAMTLFEEYIYWTDWETKSINRAHKTLGTNKSTLISTLHRPMDIHIYHPYRQPDGKTRTSSRCMIKGMWSFYQISHNCWNSSSNLKSFHLFLSAQPPVSDEQWWLQQPLPPVSWRRLQVCLSHQLLPCQWSAYLHVQLHSQPGRSPHQFEHEWLQFISGFSSRRGLFDEHLSIVCWQLAVQ